MNFKIQSLKRNEDSAGNLDFTIKVQTESGMTITKTLEGNVLAQGLEILATDVTREIKMALRKDVQQLNLIDGPETK